MMTTTEQQAAARAEMARRYRAAWFAVHGQLTAIEQILEEDFPTPDSGTAAPTRYDLDAVTALGWQLSALVEGHERRVGQG